MNEYQAELQEELDAEERHIAEQEVQQDAAFHWNRIKMLLALIETQVQDLKYQFEEINKSPLFPDL